MSGFASAHPFRQIRYICYFKMESICKGSLCTTSKSQAHGVLSLKDSSFTYCSGQRCETRPVSDWQRWFGEKPPSRDPLPNMLQFQAERPHKVNGIIYYADNFITLSYDDLLLSGTCK